MIDQEIFLQQMALLADRIGKPLAGPTQREYHRQLSASLTTEQFVAASTLLFNTWSAEFRNWPAPAQFVAAVAPESKPALSAVEMFERVLSVTTDSRLSLFEARAKVESLGDVPARAFRAAGGLRDFRGALEQDIPWLRKRFVEAYELACENADATQAATLALGDADKRLAGLVSGLAATKAMPGAMNRIGAGV